jgi:signal transduction histidine kinase
LLRSFRSRLLLGTVLGTAGLLALSHLLTVLFLGQHRVTLRLGNSSVMAVLALICIAVGLSQVQRGLSPFNRLRERLAAVRDGRDRRIEGTYPTEVEPLVSDLNGLLEHREGIVRRALATAGDLAHGLKTPLAVLSQEAQLAQAAGHVELATTIGQQVERMRRQVDYHLAHARGAASGAALGARCSVLASAEGLSRTMLRLHAGRGLAIDVNVPPEHSARVERQELDEMLGNLLDNACKWAKSRITITSAPVAGGIVITVDDDGPGLAPSLRGSVLQRGVRADEAAPGSGFGLAIVADLAELHGGSIALSASPAGGLRARLQLPV